MVVTGMGKTVTLTTGRIKKKKPPTQQEITFTSGRVCNFRFFLV
jgi:hypothetical protein